MTTIIWIIRFFLPTPRSVANRVKGRKILKSYSQFHMWGPAVISIYNVYDAPEISVANIHSNVFLCAQPNKVFSFLDFPLSTI